MGKKQKRWLAGILIGMMLIASGCHFQSAISLVSTTKSEERVLRLATDLPENSPGYQQLVDFQKRLAGASDNRLQVKLYPAGAWSEDDSLLSYLGLETLELVCLSSHRLSGTVPDFEIFDLPYLFANRQELTDYTTGRPGAEALALVEALDYKALGFVGNGQQYFLQTRGSAAVNGWAGLNMVIEQRPLWRQALTAVGIHPVDNQASGVFYDAYCLGEAEVKKLMGQQIINEGTFLGETEMFYNLEIVLGDAKWWSGLAEEDRELIEQSFAQALAQNMEDMQSRWASDVFSGGGVTVDTVTAGQKMALYQATSGVRQQYFYSGASRLSSFWRSVTPDEALSDE